LVKTGNAPADLEDTMEKKIAGLLGAIATLGAFNAAEAAPIHDLAATDVLRANSFADLLEPIANAAALLRVVDESRPNPSADENVQLAQFYHHHHHHHHSFYRRSDRYEYERPRIVVVPPRYRRYYRHHHHHHHHHHSFYRRDY
jgi:hypothetical protein